MPEAFKVNPNLISKHKPESSMAERPIGMVPLDKAFFEKLRASLPEKAMPAFNEFVKLRPKKGKEKSQYDALLQLVPYIKDQEMVNALSSYFLDKSDSETTQGFKGYLAAHSDKIEHHRLYSTARRKLLKSVGPDGYLPKETFNKSGSQLDLIGGSQFGKRIIRYVTNESFECWKEALLSKNIWEKAGFDYVPIEPITYSSNGNLNVISMKEGHIGVVAKVLGKNIFDFMRNPKNKHFGTEIKLQKEKIEKILKDQLHIDHGHTHEGNFCVEKIGDSVRVYLIDFDQARKI